MKTIGAVLIESGDFKLDDVPMRLIVPKDFSCDSIALTFSSEDTFSKILSLNRHQCPRSMVVMCVNLFFMWEHLFSVNIKNSIKPIERVQIIWHSLLWFFHIDSVSIITKKNYFSECVSLCFLILRNDITQIHTLTTEPSQHSNALMRGITREFTNKALICLVAKLDRF